MILTLYDKSHAYIGSITKKRDLKVESQLGSGDKTLSFVNLDKSLELIPEYYIRDGRDEYVVKETDHTTAGFQTVYAALNLEELEGKAWKSFQAENCTISEAAQLAIAGTGWTVAASDVTKKRNAGIVKKSALGVLEDLCTVFLCEMSFDTINKAITFHSRRGSDRGVYFLAGLNLLQLTKKSDSYDFYTRIIPYGADGLDIKEVNSGVEYLDNTQYSSKVRTYIWEDTNYTDAQALKDDATAKLADMSKPKVSYSAQIIDLAKLSAAYSLLDFGLGDVITLIDKETGTRDQQRIVKLVEYPEEPDKNTCELSNVTLTWEEMQAKLQASAAIVDAMIGTDGNYNGTIKVSDILHFADGVVGTSGGSNVTLGSFFQTTSGAIGALDLEVGRIAANMLTAETADLRYANITLANIDTANINTAKVKDLFVQVGLIRDAVISGAKITGYLDAVEVNAASITAGTLIADRIAIRGSTTSLVYALNNYGQIVSQQTNTIDGYILTERTINANKIVANSITGGEIAANTITAFNIVGNSLSAIYADLGEITAGVLKSQNYAYSNGTYTTAGMIIDLNNQVIRAQKFSVNNQGVLYASEAQISGRFESTNGTESCVLDSDVSGAYVLAANNATSIRMQANADGSVGIYEVDPILGGIIKLWERTGISLVTELGLYISEGNTSWVSIGTGGNIEITNTNGSAVLRVRNSTNGNEIRLEANPSGSVFLGSRGANGTSYNILQRRPNEHTITAYGNWEFGNQVTAGGNILVGPSKTQPYSQVGAWIGTNGNITLVYDSTSGGGGGIYFGYKGTNTYSVGLKQSAAGQLQVIGSLDASMVGYDATGIPIISDSANTNRVALFTSGSSGRVGIKAQFGGSSYTTGYFNVPASDIRLKENVKDCALSALPVINAIRMREFDWKQDGKHQRIGIIADELEQIDSRLAIGGGYTDDGAMSVKSVDTFYLVGYLVKAVQELSAEVERLRGAS